MATTVIIPARNEEATIGAIVDAFQMHSCTKNNIYVGIDGGTTDNTAREVLNADAVPIPLTDVYGKGQVVARCVFALQAANLITSRVILCDGDYTGLKPEHINQILGRSRGMVIGMPDWPEIEVPEHVIDAWPKVSGFRCLPETLIPLNAHGYLLETQLNIRAANRGLPVHIVSMAGLKSPFQWPLAPKRMAELQQDREWGVLHGIL